jgi:transposase
VTVVSNQAGVNLCASYPKKLRISMDGAYFLFCGAPQNRKGIDSLAQLCREKLDADPFSGCLFIFRSRRGTTIKLLAYDGQGFWLATKRLSKGRFKWWPSGSEPARILRAHQAQLLLAAANPDTEAPPVWRQVSA